jgi:uncharacterized protein
MIRITELRLPLHHAPEDLRAAVLQKLGVDDSQLLQIDVFRRGYDARRKSAIQFVYTLDCTLQNEAAVLAAHVGDQRIQPTPDMSYRFKGQGLEERLPQRNVVHTTNSLPARPVVVGFGPCGLFAALVLAQMGLRPLVLERGPAVRQRTKDTWALWRRGVLTAESNVQFGEGGAGTFSDGKLWSQISDPRHLTRKVLTEFVKAGAPEEILWVSKPHIGTFRLVGVIEKMRATIEALGGEIRFNQRVSDVLIENQHLRGLVLASGEQISADHVIWALGHSARDTFTMLHERGVYMEAKPFSIGFRIEHPQGVIDRARFGTHAGDPLLGAADYKLVHHARNGRSVYSFCMCPGGTVVAATSEPDRVVTNGMSQYSRNERNANAGLVVGISPADYAQTPNQAIVNPLDGLAFQRFWESRAYELGSGNYLAPGQKVGDFIKGQTSAALGDVEPSYKPGVSLVDLNNPKRPSLPLYALEAIREAIPAFARQIPGFAMPDAILTGVETRTSSPLRITRGADGQSLNTKGFYPAGEGAGYAGGIMSAGVDGIEAAEAVMRSLMKST